MARGNRRKKQKLIAVSLGITEIQDAHLRVLMRLSGKGKARLIREAIDVFFQQYRLGDGTTCGDAEARFLRERFEDARDGDRGDGSGHIPGQLSIDDPMPDPFEDEPDHHEPPIPRGGST